MYQLGFWESFKDSWYHYRRHVGLRGWSRLYRSLYYTIMKKEPYA